MGPRAPTTYWLDGEGGRVVIGPASVLVGRSADCDIVIPDARMSRHHALFRLTDGGVEVLPVGRQTVRVNGEPRSGPTALRAGDRVECLGLHFAVAEERASRGPEPDVLWGVERSPGTLFRVAQTAFQIGGGADDHLVVRGWPPSAVLLHRVGNGLALEAAVAGVSAGGVALAEGECVPLANGARVAYGGESWRVVALPRDPTQATASSGADELPRDAELRFMPRGGRLSLDFGARTASVYLSDRRCDLVACLLQPPSPFAPGEVVPDETLLERVWSDSTQGRVELNTLIFRTRRDLLKAEIDGASLIVREGGGARMRLAPGATVRVFTT